MNLISMSLLQDSTTLSDISLHGSLLVQALLKFQVPKVIVNSLLKMPPDDIIGRLSCDPSGSHVITAFLTSATISVKKKNKLIKILEVRPIVLISQHWFFMSFVQSTTRHLQVACRLFRYYTCNYINTSPRQRTDNIVNVL